MSKGEEQLSPVTRQVIRDLRGRKDFDDETVKRVVDDLKKRDLDGQAKFGIVLGEPDDPRDWLVELEEEVLDAAQYAKAEIMRRALKRRRAVNIMHLYQQLLTLLVNLKMEREAARKGRFAS